MKRFFLNNYLYFIGALAGGISGFLYYKFIGCTSGTCPISSNPYRSTLYFAAMGALFFGIFKKDKTVSAK